MLNRIYAAIDPNEVDKLGLPKCDFADLSTPIPPKKAEPRQLTPEETKELSREGRSAYEKLNGLVQQGKFEEFLPHVLDNGRFVERQRLIDKHDEVVAALKETQPVLREIDALKAAPGEPQVSIDSGSIRDERETVTVTWKLKGTEDIGRRLWMAASDRHTVERSTGTLIVLMKKKGGTWYWNPFGW